MSELRLDTVSLIPTKVITPGGNVQSFSRVWPEEFDIGHHCQSA
jgi:hypothetical protein